MTVILTFWVCLTGVECPAPAGVATIQMEYSTLARCEEINAITDDKYIERFLTQGHSPRHSCVFSGDPL